MEDDPLHAEALARLIRLSRPGASVRQADDGLSAGLLLGTLNPHVAFVDVEIPGLDGIEVIRRALEQPTLRGVQFVVVSGFLTEPRRSELERLGVRHILPKPVKPVQVRSVLDELPEMVTAT